MGERRNKPHASRGHECLQQLLLDGNRNGRNGSYELLGEWVNGMNAKSSPWLLSAGGAVLGALLVLSSGLFAIQRDGLEIGALLSPITNKLTSVTNPQHAIIPTLAITALCLVVVSLLIIAFRTLDRSRRMAFFLSFVVVVGALILWGYISGPVGGVAADIMSDSIPSGPLGWIENASRLSAVHVVALLGVAALVFGPRMVDPSSPKASSPTSEEPSEAVVKR